MRLAQCRRAGSSTLHPSTLLLLEIICDLKKINNAIVELVLWLGPELGKGDSSSSRVCKSWLGAFSSISCGFLLGFRSASEDAGGWALDPRHVQSAPQIQGKERRAGAGGRAEARGCHVLGSSAARSKSLTWGKQPGF